MIALERIGEMDLKTPRGRQCIYTLIQTMTKTKSMDPLETFRTYGGPAGRDCFPMILREQWGTLPKALIICDLKMKRVT